MNAALAECLRLTNAIYRRRRQHPGAEDEDCPWERRCMERIDALYQGMSVAEQERADHASMAVWDRWNARYWGAEGTISVQEFLNHPGSLAARMFPPPAIPSFIDPEWLQREPGEGAREPDHQIDALRYAILRAPPDWQDVCDTLAQYLRGWVRHERIISAEGAYHVLLCDGARITVTDLELATEPDVRRWAEALDRQRRAAASMPRRLA